MKKVSCRFGISMLLLCREKDGFNFHQHMATDGWNGSGYGLFELEVCKALDVWFLKNLVREWFCRNKGSN